jgi:hypothetical protein
MQFGTRIREFEFSKSLISNDTMIRPMSENINASANRSTSTKTADSKRSAPRRVVEWLANRNSFVIIGVFFGLGLAGDHVFPSVVDQQGEST